VAGDDASLIVDTGHPKDWLALSAQLDELAEQGIAGVRYVFPTHSEMPHSANLGRLLEKYPDAVAIGDIRDYHLSFPDLQGRLCEMRAGDELDLGGTRFILVEAVIRDLVTSYWGFDTRDRTLFASDGFAYMHHHRAAECGLLADELDGLPVAEFTAVFARHALYWTRFTDMRPPVERLLAALAELEVAAIAPGHGCPIIELDRTVPEVVRGMLMGAGDQAQPARP
jgi:flavorubredoxin